MTKKDLTERIKAQNDESNIVIELEDGTRHKIERVSQDGNAILLHINNPKETISTKGEF